VRRDRQIAGVASLEGVVKSTTLVERAVEGWVVGECLGVIERMKVPGVGLEFVVGFVGMLILVFVYLKTKSKLGVEIMALVVEGFLSAEAGKIRRSVVAGQHMELAVRLLVEEATVLMKAEVVVVVLTLEVVVVEILLVQVAARVLAGAGDPIGVALAVVVVKVVVGAAGAVHNLVAEGLELEVPLEMRMMVELVQQKRRHDREM
jgi:hypothetical protein